MATSTEARPFDTVGFIMALEGGSEELTEEDVIAGFQHLIDTGTVWGLQGSYGRMAAALIEAGHCTDSRPAKPARPDLVGTFCECGAAYDEAFGGYGCAR